MDGKLSDRQLRTQRIARQSHNPFGKNYSTEVRSPRNLKLVENSEGNELHHNRIVDVLAPFFSGNPIEDLCMIDHLQQRGISVGNHDINLTGMPGSRHQTGDDSIHRFAIENNIQANLKGMQNTPDDGSGYAYMEGVRAQISALPFEERLKALDIFCDQIQPALDEKMAAMGYTQPSRAQVAADWRKAVDAEHDAIVYAHNKRQLKKMINPEAERFKQVYVDQLLDYIRRT